MTFGKTRDEVFDKLNEETAELKAAIESGDTANVEEEVGDLLFVIQNLARHLGVEPETALKKTNRKFRSRFKYIEDELGKEGRSLEDASLGEMDGHWNRSKTAV